MSEAKILQLKARLRRKAEEKFPGNAERQNAYIFGTINKIRGQK